MIFEDESYFKGSVEPGKVQVGQYWKISVYARLSKAGRVVFCENCGCEGWRRTNLDCALFSPFHYVHYDLATPEARRRIKALVKFYLMAKGYAETFVEHKDESTLVHFKSACESILRLQPHTRWLSSRRRDACIAEANADVLNHNEDAVRLTHVSRSRQDHEENDDHQKRSREDAGNLNGQNRTLAQPRSISGFLSIRPVQAQKFREWVLNIILDDGGFRSVYG